MPHGLRAITFDAAGTLIHVAEPVGETYARSFRRHGIEAMAEDVERRFRAAFAAAPALAFPGVEGAARLREERAWWREIVRRASGLTAARLDAVTDELFAVYAQARSWSLAPDAEAVLAGLVRRGFRLGVVSNFDSRLPGILSGLGVAPLFSVVVDSASAGSAKPDPAIFLVALRALGVRPDEALHVGDDAALDVAGARAAGMRALHLDPGGEPSADRIGGLAALAERV